MKAGAFMAKVGHRPLSRGARRFRHARQGSPDGANLLAMEGVVIAMFLMVALVMFSHLNSTPDPFPGAGAQKVVERHLHSVLNAMKMMDDPEYGTKLQRFIVECSNGNEQNLSAFMKSALPTGVGYRLSISQDHQLLTLCQSDYAVPRQVESASLIMWGWAQDTAFVVPEYLNYDGEHMAMQTTVIPLRNGYVEETYRDLELQVDVELEDIAYINMHRLALRPGPHLAVGVVKGSNVVAYFDNTEDNRFTLRIQESGGDVLPAGSEMVVRLPASWSDLSLWDYGQGWTNAGWTTEGAYHVISATLQSDLRSSSLDFSFNATRPVANEEGAGPFHGVVVEFRDMPNTRSPLLFKGLVETSSLAGNWTRGSVLNLPERATPGSSGTWRVVVMNPDPEESQYDAFGQCALNCRTLSQVTVHQPGGVGVFEAVSGAGWALGGPAPASSLVWTGSVEMASDEALELPFSVTLVDAELGGVYNGSRRVQFPVAEVSMDLRGMAGFGMHTGRYPVEGATLPGYPSVVGPNAALGVCSDVHIDGRLHAGCANYTIRRTPLFLNARESIALGTERSSLAVEGDRSFSVGDTITLRANFSALDAAMAAWPGYMETAETVVTLYHPWTAKNTSLSAATAWWRGTAKEADLETTILVEGPVVYGTYVVVAERRFNLTANAGLGQPFVFTSENTDQVVRKVTWLTLGKQPSLERTFFHTVVLHGWLPDWD